MQHKKRILIISNHPPTQRLFNTAFLDHSNYAVTCVENQNDATSLIHQNKHLLMFIDLQEDATSCLQVLQQTRARSMTIPIYILTDGHPEFLMRLDEARTLHLAFQLIKKPIGSIELTALAQSVLDKPILA